MFTVQQNENEIESRTRSDIENASTCNASSLFELFIRLSELLF